jgi:hypothetical protein
MTMRHVKLGMALTAAVLAASVSWAQPASPRVLKATATLEREGGATITAPVVITIKRIMSEFEANKYATAYRRGGEKALRAALVDIPTTGTVQLGRGKPVPTRITTERKTEKGRQLTIVTDQPLLFLGASLPDAKPKTGYNFAVIELLFDDKGAGSGTMATAAWIKLDPQGGFAVQDYSGELVKLTVASK